MKFYIKKNLNSRIYKDQIIDSTSIGAIKIEVPRKGTECFLETWVIPLAPDFSEIPLLSHDRYSINYAEMTDRLKEAIENLNKAVLEAILEKLDPGALEEQSTND